jgi:hypothetical protein
LITCVCIIPVIPQNPYLLLDLLLIEFFLIFI